MKSVLHAKIYLTNVHHFLHFSWTWPHMGEKNKSLVATTSENSLKVPRDYNQVSDKKE